MGGGGEGGGAARKRDREWTDEWMDGRMLLYIGVMKPETVKQLFDTIRSIYMSSNYRFWDHTTTT